MGITLDGAAADVVRAEAQADGIEVDDLISNYLSLGIADSTLIRDGWEGPIYQRPTEKSGKFGKFLTFLGLNYPEQMRISRNPDEYRKGQN